MPRGKGKSTNPADKAKPVDQAAIDRLARASARAASASRTAPQMGAHDTPFGKVTLTDKGRGKGGEATTNRKDHPGSTAFGALDGKYRAILQRTTSDTLRAVIAASSNASMRPGGSRQRIAVPAVPDLDQRREAALLMGVGLSEEQRALVAPKPFRAGLRAAAAAAPAKRAEAFFAKFPQAAPAAEATSRGYATGARALLSVPATGVKHQRGLAAHAAAGGSMSDSSDDEKEHKPPRIAHGMGAAAAGAAGAGSGSGVYAKRGAASPTGAGALSPLMGRVPSPAGAAGGQPKRSAAAAAAASSLVAGTGKSFAGRMSSPAGAAAGAQPKRPAAAAALAAAAASSSSAAVAGPGAGAKRGRFEQPASAPAPAPAAAGKPAPGSDEPGAKRQRK